MIDPPSLLCEGRGLCVAKPSESQPPRVGLLLLWLAPIALALVLPACGGAQVAKLNKDVTGLKEQVAELRRGQAAQRVQFDGFRNRLVMLQDRLESDQVAAARRMARARRSSTARSDAMAEPPLLRQVVVPAPSTPATKQPSIVPSRNVTIGPDGVVRDVVPRAGRSRNRGAAKRSGRSATRVGVTTGRRKKAAAGGKRSTPAGPRPSANDRPPGDRPSPDEVAAGQYREAKTMLDTGRLRDARERFEAFLQAHPRHALADNALYWTGETWYAQAMWLKAARSFGEVVGRYPKGNKVPDAMLKTGLCYRKVGEERLASEVFVQLRDLYPGTHAARLAITNLTQMGGQR